MPLPTPNKTPGDGAPADDINLIIEAINTLQGEVDNIPAGPQGPQGEPGTPGAAGANASVTVGSTTTGAAGSSAAVTNIGTAQNAILEFTIPQGATGATGAAGAQGPQGPAGSPGVAAAISVGSTTTGAEGSMAQVTNSGTSSNAVLNFVIPRGDTGPAANLGTSTPQNLGTAAAGTSVLASRQDHVHAMPTAGQVGADPAGSASAVNSTLSAHTAATTSVHGISNTANLVYTNDSRLTDARTPTAHASTHGSAGSDPITVAQSQVTNLTTDLSAKASATDLSNHTSATTTVHGISNTANLVYTNDSRLTDARTPTAHAASHGASGSDAITVAQSQVTNLTTDLSGKASATDLSNHTSATTSVHGISNTANLVYTSDSRLSDARTPTSHAASHESGGSDELELAPAQITGTAIVAGDVHLITFVTSSTRPGSPTEGMIIYETDTNLYYGWNGTNWVAVGGGAKGGGTDDIFFENGQTVTTNYTITSSKNALSAGPITINSGITVTVPSGSYWTVV